jgi:hypothetical protein
MFTKREEAIDREMLNGLEKLESAICYFERASSSGFSQLKNRKIEFSSEQNFDR